MSFGWSDLDYKPGSTGKIRSKRTWGEGGLRNTGSRSPEQQTQRGRPAWALGTRTRRNPHGRRTHGGTCHKPQAEGHNGGRSAMQTPMRRRVAPHGASEQSPAPVICVGHKGMTGRPAALSPDCPLQPTGGGGRSWEAGLYLHLLHVLTEHAGEMSVEEPASAHLPGRA